MVVKRSDGELVELTLSPPRPVLVLSPSTSDKRPRTDFLNLPREILLQILASIDPKDVLVTSMACKELSAICRDQRLWSSLNYRHSVLDGLVPQGDELFFDLFQDKLNRTTLLKLAWRKLLRFTGILLRPPASRTSSSFSHLRPSISQIIKFREGHYRLGGNPDPPPPKGLPPLAAHL